VVKDGYIYATNFSADTITVYKTTDNGKYDVNPAFGVIEDPAALGSYSADRDAFR